MTSVPDQRPVVQLVGAGPGDPTLLTRRAARLLEAADVVVVDRRSLDHIAALAPAAAERVFVGKTGREPAWSTEAVADLLADRAQRGSNVVRLKSGDPFVCSRGAEEVTALAERSVRTVVTPGVSAATAAPLAAALPLGRTVTIVSGNSDPVYPEIDLASLADPLGSLVVLTGRARQGSIGASLVAAGLDPATPAVIVHAATRAGEHVVRTTLAGLGEHRLPPPATFVVGPTDEGRAHT